jgi:hypothetical protein
MCACSVLLNVLRVDPTCKYHHENNVKERGVSEGNTVKNIEKKIDGWREEIS